MPSPFDRPSSALATALALAAATALAAAHHPAPPAAAQPAVYAQFALNTQDFSYPERSAATVHRVLDIHERHGVPVDVYLTDTILRLYETVAPDLIDRLRASTVAEVSSHNRPPRPYHTGYDWLGLAAMAAADQQAVILRYETHAVDPVTGRTTDDPGGYAFIADTIGYTPWIGAFLADAPIGSNVAAVFRQLGARMRIVHGRIVNAGEQIGGLYVRPEHVDLRLFEHVGEEPGPVLDAAVAEARAAAGARGPYFVGIKMHDNDFFAVDSAWVTVYQKDRRRPPWNPTLQSPLLADAEQAAMWALYEGTVAEVAAGRAGLQSVNARGLWTMLTGQQATPRPTAAHTEPPPTAAAPTSPPPATAPPPASPPPASPTVRPTAIPIVYVSGSMHIETNPESWPDVTALLDFYRRVTAAGRVGAQPTAMRWSIGVDIGWLRGEPRAKEAVLALEAMGVDMDVHAHAAADRPVIAALLTGWGAHPNRVASGVLAAEFDALRLPLAAPDGTRWQAEVTWGFANRAGHGPGADDRSTGVWRPKSGAQMTVHDPRANLISVGGGSRDTAGVDAYVGAVTAAVARGQALPPVLSTSVMINARAFNGNAPPVDVPALAAWADRSAASPHLRWATIRETAAAWVAAGEVPSRADDGALPDAPPDAPPGAATVTVTARATGTASATAIATASPAAPTATAIAPTAVNVDRATLYLPWAGRRAVPAPATP